MNRRLLAVVLAVAVPAALVATAGDDPSERAAGQRPVAVEAVPVADPVEALSSSWFCAMGTSTTNGAADLTVQVVNTTDVVRRGSVEWFPTDDPATSTPGAAPRVHRDFEVPPLGELRLVASQAVVADRVSAVVETEGGGVVVSHTVTNARGSADAPCASDPSSTWHFANGVTQVGVKEELALFNPYGDDVVVDIRAFSSPEGSREEPTALQGVPVPAGSTVWVDVSAQVVRRQHTSLTVAARSGRLVVDRMITFEPVANLPTGQLPRAGVSLAAGARGTSGEWWFPVGRWGEGEAQRWFVYNPGDVEAEASIEVVVPAGTPPEPIDVVVPARSHVVVSPSADNGVPVGVHGAVVRSLNGVGIVVEREDDRRAPHAPGWASAFGQPAGAERWLVPATGPATRAAATVAQLGLVNPGTDRVTVSVSIVGDGGTLVPVPGLQAVAIDPGAVRIESPATLGTSAWRTLLVEADGPVVAARDVFGPVAPHLALQGGVRLGGR